MITADRHHLRSLTQWLDAVDAGSVEATDRLELILEDLLLLLVIRVLLFLLLSEFLRGHVET